MHSTECAARRSAGPGAGRRRRTAASVCLLSCACALGFVGCPFTGVGRPPALHGQGSRDAAAAPSGLSPQQIQNAYAIPAVLDGGSPTVAIIGEQDDPTALSD